MTDLSKDILCSIIICYRWVQVVWFYNSDRWFISACNKPLSGLTRICVRVLSAMSSHLKESSKYHLVAQYAQDIYIHFPVQLIFLSILLLYLFARVLLLSGFFSILRLEWYFQLLKPRDMVFNVENLEVSI